MGLPPRRSTRPLIPRSLASRQSMRTGARSSRRPVVRGTSFASPIVAGLLAGRLHAPDQAQAVRAVADLANSAIDLGDPGPDPVYGYGLVGASLGPEPALARIRE